MANHLEFKKPHDEEVFFENYKPPSRDAIPLPNYIIYLFLASVVALVALYAIIRHLIKELIHDLADYLFGVQPDEQVTSPWECRDKFQVDWCPETSPELEAMVKAEEVQCLLEGTRNIPTIWVISDGREPQPPRPGTGSRVAGSIPPAGYSLSRMSNEQLNRFHTTQTSRDNQGFIMSLHKYLLICLLLGVCVDQAQGSQLNEGSRITTAKGGTLQPWIVGLSAVVGFLFIVFVILVVRRVFLKKEREEDGGWYENKAMDTEEGENASELKQTNL
ncbi:hypothetical protein DPEC_G00267290 [Dallia pectoralis]|uniref:Uncharacterized protein n=1 Tax=Dallia pectoralis TaxID=75939 RepID=A0ACC2FNP5_DALPE|nr:hypothetical protein DPEC_G00267290 [Dallia pectoralis]